MEYTHDIVAIVRRKTFSIVQSFDLEEQERPLMIFGKYARFVFTNIENHTSVFANLPVDELPAIVKKTDYAFGKHMDAKCSVKADAPSRPAFSVRFMMGNYKGKTPADILAENGDSGRNILNEQYKWYAGNIEKYPNNRKYLEAIRDAATLTPEELTAGCGTSGTAPVEIYKADCRPLIRRTRQDGKCLCYEMAVIWDSSRNYPVSVKITQYYASVQKKETGLLEIDFSSKDKDSETSIEVNLTAEDWLYCVSQMQDSVSLFKSLHYGRALQIADSESERNRQQAKKMA